jgi:hypothetical protein
MSLRRLLASMSLRLAAPVLACTVLLLLPGLAAEAQEDAQQAWQRLQQLLGDLVDEDREEPMWANDPWDGNEDARRSWCAAMADTHQSDWSSGMIPGEVRGRGNDLEKAQQTGQFFKTANKAFGQLVTVEQPDELRANAKGAANLVRTEAGVYEAFDWDYARALSQGATLAPPLGVPFARELADYLTPLTLVQERWCWVDPEDRG